MDTKVAIGLVAGAVLIGTYAYEAKLDKLDANGPLSPEYSQGPEALGWLRKSGNESALASNRFLGTENAVRFVRQLYDAGAERVIVPQACITQDEVETYADGLVVTLPADEARRQRVWRICAEEIRREGEDPGEVGDDKQVFLWWD